MESVLKRQCDMLQLIAQKQSDHYTVKRPNSKFTTYWQYVSPHTPTLILVKRHEINKLVSRATKGYAYFYFSAIDGQHVFALTPADLMGCALETDEGFQLEVCVEHTGKDYEDALDLITLQPWFQESLDIPSMLSIDHEVPMPTQTIKNNNGREHER